MRRSLRALAGLALAAAFPSCSLMGLDDFDVMKCTRSEDCAAADEKYPSAGPCGDYVCDEAAGLCVVRDGTEQCNGLDDDCDGRIDEDVLIEPPTSADASLPMNPIAHAALVSPPRTYVAVASEIDDGAAGYTLAGDGASDRHSLRYVSSASVSGECPTDADPAPCDFLEVALAGDAANLVFVSVNKRNCAPGQIRIGISQRQVNPYDVWLGARDEPGLGSASNIGAGVDIVRGPNSMPCTGASRLNDGGTVGASRPAVAVLDSGAGKEGALALWLAWPETQALEARGRSCAPIPAVAVEALGVFVPESAALPWLNGREDGTPFRVGFTTRGSAPAVVAVPHLQGPNNGYVVAFAGADEADPGIELHDVYPERHSKLDTVNGDQPLDWISEPEPGQVALALGRSEPEANELGIAWVSGCSSAPIVRFGVRALGGAQPGSNREVSLFSADAGITNISALSVHYEATGFSAEPPTGGWFVLWIEERGNVRDLKLARVREGTLEILPIATLRSGGIGYPVLDPTGEGSVGYALVGSDGDLTSSPKVTTPWCDSG